MLVEFIFFRFLLLPLSFVDGLIIIYAPHNSLSLSLLLRVIESFLMGFVLRRSNQLLAVLLGQKLLFKPVGFLLFFKIISLFFYYGTPFIHLPIFGNRVVSSVRGLWPYFVFVSTIPLRVDLRKFDSLSSVFKRIQIQMVAHI